MKKETIQKIIKASICTSNDTTRFHLNHVLVNAQDIVATDGHKMVVLKHQDSEIFAKDYLVSESNVKTLKMILKSYGKYIEDILYARCDEGVEVYSSEKEFSTLIKTAETLNIKYPNYKQLIPEKKERVRIAFDAKYLYQIADSLNDGQKHRGVTIEIKVNRDKDNHITGVDAISPLVVKRASDDFAVLMPMRL